MLTELQKQKMTHLFNVLDYDGNHTIERADFESLGENLCTLLDLKEGTIEYNKCVSRCMHQWEKLQKLAKKDPDHVDLEEWLSFTQNAVIDGNEDFYVSYIQKIANEIFEGFDTNGDGYISLEEFVDLFLAYKIDLRYSGRSFTNLDRNGDDRISRKEVVSALHDFFKSNNKNAHGNWLLGFWRENTG